MKISDSKYIQKSKLFLVPLLEIKRDNFIKPISTYIFDQSKPEERYKLIMPFKKEDSSEFDYYENNLLNCKYVDQLNYYETESLRVYFFDLSNFEQDYELFLNGKYSQFSTKTKALINLYWGRIVGGRFVPHEKIQSYINPSLETYEQLSDELQLKLEDLITVKEVLNPPDLIREVFDADTVKIKESLEG